MATITAYSKYSLPENLKRTSPEGNVRPVVEVLAQKNQMLNNAPMKEANEIYSHVASKRNELPTPGLRSFNEGGTKDVSKVEQIRESIMMLDLNIEIDEDLIDPYPNPTELRMIETRAQLMGAAQELSRLVLYGNKGDDARECDGLATRFPTTSYDNVTSIGGTSSSNDLTEAFMVEWDELAAYLIHPKGFGNGGIKTSDKGRIRVTDSSNNPFWAYAEQIKLQLGLAVVDDRAVQRFVNIEASGTSNNFIDTSNGKHHELVYARNRLPNMGMDGNTYIYVNRTVKSQFDIFAMDKANGFYTVADGITGEPLTTFQGIPIMMMESILSTYNTVS